MKIIPQNSQIAGRVVEIAQTKSGLVLADAKKATIFVLIDTVGQEVTRYKAGDIVLPHHTNHVFLRNGFHLVLFEEKDVLCVVEDVDLSLVSIEGKPVEPVVRSA